MTRMLNTVSQRLTSMIGNVMLIVIATAVSVCGVGLAALYMVDHVRETPGMKTLRCYVVPAYADCPHYAEAMDKLQSELTAMGAERNRLERQLAGLRAIEQTVDSITLFKNNVDPRSGITVVVGTVYDKFVEAAPRPLSYFCYLQLPNGAAGEDRSLYIRNGSDFKAISAATLERTGISEATLAFARSVCQPRLIGAGA